MNRGIKTALGVATLLPLLYVLVITFALMLVIITRGVEGLTDEGAPGWFRVLASLNFPTQLLAIGLTVFYFVNVFRNRRVERSLRVMWAIILPLFNLIVIPAYWYLYIWRDAAAPRAAVPPSGR